MGVKRDFPDIPGQHGLATRAQLLARGWSYATIDRYVHNVGREPFHSIIAPHAGPLDRLTVLTAAALWAGPAALLTGAAALECRGFLPLGEASGFHFLIAAPGWCAESHVARRIRTRRPMPAGDEVGAIRLAPFTRSLVDMARHRECSRTRARALTLKALQRKLVTADELRAEIRAGRRNDTKAVRLGIDDYVGGAWSLPEAWLSRVVGRGRFPTMMTNPDLLTPEGEFIGAPDGYFESAGVAVQVHSKEFHSGEDADGTDRWASTVEHDSDYAAHGILVVGVVPTTLRDAPERFLRRLSSAISSQAGRPLPRVVAVPRAA